MIGSLWPLTIILCAVTGSVFREVARDRLKRNSRLVTTRSSFRSVVLAGLQRTLPLILTVTFLMVPSTSTRIFKTFMCDSVEYRRRENPIRYLHEDLSLRCDSSLYDTTRATAFVLVVFWPVG